MAEASPEVELSAADREKKLGNEFFAKKEYDSAIKHYTAAIALDETNPFYYSNRSACWAAKKEWQAAYEDALLSVSKDDKFVKGYLRLAVAQTELDLLDDAEKTLRAALTLDNSNALVGQQIKKLQQRKKAKANANMPKRRQLDEQQQKELMALGEEARKYSSDLQAVQTHMGQLERENAQIANTMRQIDGMPETTPLYRAVGKAYFKIDRSKIGEVMQTDVDNNNKSLTDLKGRAEYNERRLQSTQSNIRELTQAP